MSTASARVALVVGNSGLIDTRVVKYATSLAEAGYDVRVLCHSTDDRRHEIAHGGACYVQLPAQTRPTDRNAILRGVARYWGKAMRVSRRTMDRLAIRLAPDRTGSGLGSPIRRWELTVYRQHPRLAPWRMVCRSAVAAVPGLHRELDAFAPALVHQHDVHELNATASWVTRRRAAGADIAFVYDAREYVAGQPNPPARQVMASASMEREFIGVADRVITVSEPIADQLVQAYGLARRPEIVLNAAWSASDPHTRPHAPLRQILGLTEEVPLLAYIGGLAQARGVHTTVQALRDVPEAHLAIVSRAESSYTRLLRQVAADCGVTDRMHIVPFVEPDQVVSLLTGCDIGLSPLLHAPNHDWALTNKFFEYLQAGLVVVSSDTPVQAELIRSYHLGTVFPAGDVAQCASAIRLALKDLRSLRESADEDLLRRFSWAEQARTLLRIYTEELGPAAHPAP